MFNTDAATIFTALEDVLLRCILPVSSCRGQSYDGASGMSGHCRGVATRFKQAEPVALYVYTAWRTVLISAFKMLIDSVA